MSPARATPREARETRRPPLNAVLPDRPSEAHVRLPRAHLGRTEAASAACGGNHRRYRVVEVYGDDLLPPWTEREQGERCSCGAEQEFFSVVDVFHP